MDRYTGADSRSQVVFEWLLSVARAAGTERLEGGSEMVSSAIVRKGQKWSLPCTKSTEPCTLVIQDWGGWIYLEARVLNIFVSLQASSLKICESQHL